MSSEFTYNPSFPLNKFIDIIWVDRKRHIDLVSDHHAALFTELIFNYGDEFSVEGETIHNCTNNNTKQIISGLKTKPFKTKVSGRYCSIGLIMKPYSYGILIDKFGSDTLNYLSEILFDCLLNNINPNFSETEKYLLSLFSDSKVDNDFIRFESYLKSNILLKPTLKEFNQSINISQKGFIQKFKRLYTITPNNYIKLFRISKSIELLKNTYSESLLNIGLDSGFYDQSHFIKTFRTFCGLTPKEYLKDIRSTLR